VYVYGKNTAFDLNTNGINDGTLLAEGARPGQGGMPSTPGGGPLIWSGPSSNPLSLYGIGDINNLNRTSSIAETSLTSSFQYYRIRYEGVLPENSSDGKYEVAIKEVTPVIRLFQESGTSISASNGVLSATQIISNNIIGTSSFATLANSAVSSSYALTASYIESLEGFVLDGSILTNTTLKDSTIITGSLLIATSLEDENPGNATGDLTVEGNFTLGTITDVETALISSPPLNNIGIDVLPNTTETHSLGNPAFKWKDIYAKNTFFGGIHEINLETEGLNKMQEGTVLTLRNGMMCPCENEADPLVMGIVSKGENYPIVLGAEPVLITGKIKEGDYIITSNVKGHGKGVSPQYIYSQQLFGKIIAQAIEDGEGKSYNIKAMIRKM
jgi:hypothetical protein